jgi:hypothetical protein
MLSILKADIVGYYLFKPDFEIKSYSDEKDANKLKTDNLETECVICKRSIYEPSYEHITDNSKLQEDPQIIIGKCGHIYHNDCMTKWLSTGNKTCPIDKVEWQTYRVADSITKLVLESAKVNKVNKVSTTPNNLKRVMRKNKAFDF